ncbi:MAG: chromosomal replication initiator protein DnaA [Betaproteobacteria bacterium]|nr:chromosomal replication initiator protein DnaA [Betaproteobacteria bacterium]
MATIEKSEVFFEKLKSRLKSLGLGDSVAHSIANQVVPVKFDGQTIIADCKSQFHGNLIISAKMNEIIEVAKDVWGPNIEFYVRSEPDTLAQQPRKAKSVKSASSMSLFDTNDEPGKKAQANQSKKNDKKTESKSTLNTENLVAKSEKGETSEIAPKPKISTLQATKNINQISTQMTITPIALVDDFEGKTPSTSDTSRSLNPELTFANFVRGQSNLIAYSACESIAKNPGNLTNPVFIYGATGLGKTHLLHSVGNEILRQNPTWNIKYVTSVDYMNELIQAIRFYKQEAFRNKYNHVDVLLVDDIQFLESKDSTQLEFFHTFNDLFQKRKQIVITSDKYPKDIPNIEERLKSRFLQGLIADIEPPGFEDRVAIIETKAKALNLKLTRDVILHIATHVKSNVREIQGILNNLAMTQSMTGAPPTIESTNSHLRRMIRIPTQSLDLNAIQKAVAAHFGIKLTELLAQDRSQRLVIPRHIAMYLSRELLGSATTEIAEAFGRKNHTTVMHAVEKVKELIEKDASTRAIVNELKRKLDQNLV